MQVNHIFEVKNGDTLQALRSFLVAWWNQHQPDAVLAPLEVPGESNVIPRIIEDPADLSRVNPFTPVMTGNNAGLAVQLQKERRGQRLVAILRPCELRTYTELCKIETESGTIETPADEWNGRMVLIGVDCLGTYSMKDYTRELEKRAVQELTAEAITNASAGGFRMKKYRTACQVCDWPAPWGADVVIGTIGVETSKYLLIQARDEVCDDCLSLGALTEHPAIEYVVSRRETVVGAVADAHAGVRKHLISNTPGYCRFDDLGSLLAWFATCSLCGSCLDACPLYRGEIDALIGLNYLPEAERSSLADLVRIGRWLISCSGCGMCEENCHRHVPLTLLLSALSHRIREQTDYIAGDPTQRLPWVGD